MIPEPNVWFHVTSHMYAAWLYGDPRGFRTRHHREHIEGDYKNPPPKGKYDSQFERSKKLMTQPKVILTPDWRKVVGEAVVGKLVRLGAELLAVSVSATHLHIHGRFPPAEVREWVGLAKKHAWHEARDRGWEKKLWAKRGKAERVRDHRHQQNTFNYILRHAKKEGAWVWHFRQPSPEAPPTENPAT